MEGNEEKVTIVLTLNVDKNGVLGQLEKIEKIGKELEREVWNLKRMMQLEEEAE